MLHGNARRSVAMMWVAVLLFGGGNLNIDEDDRKWRDGGYSHERHDWHERDIWRERLRIGRAMSQPCHSLVTRRFSTMS